jgi:hypothetical protein
MALSRGRRIGVAVAVLGTSAALATGITYAATTTTTKVVYACANGKGTLRLLSNGKCPTGYSKVGINKRGARGPRGLRGPAGPGALSLHAASSTSTASSQGIGIPGMGLTAQVTCDAISSGATSVLSFTDETASAKYTVSGSYQLSAATGTSVFLIYGGGSHPDLASGLNTIEYSQAKSLHAASQLEMQYAAGAGGDLTGDLAVQRAGKTALVHVVLHQDPSHCFVLAEVTPAS